MPWSWGRGNAQDKVTARSLEATKRRTAGVGKELAKMSDCQTSRFRASWSLVEGTSVVGGGG